MTKSFYPQMAQKTIDGNYKTRKSSNRSAPIVHVVQSGDTLGKIAAKYTGSVNNYKEIADYNSIADPAAIKIGQKILIPKDLHK